MNGEAGGYELIAFNLYFKCVIPGLAGNAAVWSTGGDSHYTDCVVVDYTVGFRMGRGGSNRLTRCHVWGGPLPATEPGGEREMLKNSVNFWIDGASDTILRDCYADTGKTGFLVDGWDTHLTGCRYFNNYHFKLDDITVIDHRSGRLLVSECRFNKSNPKIRAYTGIGTVEWRNMIYSNFPADADQPGALDFEVDQDCATPDDWEFLPGGKPCVLEAKPNEFAGRPRGEAERVRRQAGLPQLAPWRLAQDTCAEVPEGGAWQGAGRARPRHASRHESCRDHAHPREREGVGHPGAS